MANSFAIVQNDLKFDQSGFSIASVLKNVAVEG